MQNTDKPGSLNAETNKMSLLYTDAAPSNIVINCVTCAVTYRQKKKKSLNIELDGYSAFK